MKKKSILAILPILFLLALPVVFRQRSGGAILPPRAGKCDRLVIISAHNESIKHEYAIAFQKHYREKYGKNVELDFRSPGGTSDIVRYIADRYTAEFRKLYEADPANGKFDAEIAAAFANPKCDNPKLPFSDRQRRARKLFLESDAGIGVDLMAGGGTFDMARQAARGFAVDGKVKDRHPEYFREDVIPQRFSGDTFYDEKGRYYGVVLSTFGIACNTDRVKSLPGKDKSLPHRWGDLADGRFYNTLVVADPSKSGSAMKCYEIIIQEYMAKAGNPDQGWIDGLNVIKRIIGNSRTVSDSAGKVVRDVGSGEAAAGMAIDTYGFTEQAWSFARFPGSVKAPHFVFIPPIGGTALSADPVQLLRGAPNRVTAERFIDFLLSKEGQYLHIFRTGTPNGPVHHALQRPPIRRDVYAPENRQYWSDIVKYNPYEAGASFNYRAAWTGPYYNLLRVMIRAAMLLPQEELKTAWRAILDAGGPEKVPEAYRAFCELPFPYRDAARINEQLFAGKNSGGIGAAALSRSWSDKARAGYLRAAALAKEGR